jgi:flagellar hook-length control protein FliK
MTTPAVGPAPTIPASSKGAPNTPAPASAAGFAHQLHAARQHSDPVAQAPGADRQAPPARGQDGAHGKDPAPRKADARQPDASAERPDKARDAADAQGKASSNAAAGPQTAAKAPTPAAVSPAAPLVPEAVADLPAADAASDEKDASDSEQGAAALVSAMLALVGPAVARVLTPGATDLSATSGKSVAADAGAALLPQGDAASMSVNANVASAVMPAPWFAVADLPSAPKDLRDLTHADAAPTVALTAPTPVAPTGPLGAPILVPANPHAFAQELGQQVTWFVDQGVKQARIRLHPEELGSLDLKISVNHGRVDVAFQAQHPGAVSAVQQSLPQLAQMLAQHGLSLGNTQVGHGQHDRGDQSGHAGRGDRVSETGEIHEPGMVTPLSQLGLVDAFA